MGVAANTVAVTPLNFTILFDGVVLKFAPIIITVVGLPVATPETGAKPSTEGLKMTLYSHDIKRKIRNTRMLAVL
jgi:hypothetical protein